MNEHRTKHRWTLVIFLSLTMLIIAAWHLIPIIKTIANTPPSLFQTMMEATKPRFQNGFFAFSLKRQSFRVPAGYLAGAWHDHSGVLDGASLRAALPEFSPAGKLGRPATVKDEVEVRLQVRQGQPTFGEIIKLENHERGKGFAFGELEAFPPNDHNFMQLSFADWTHDIQLRCDRDRPSCRDCLKRCYAHRFGGDISVDFRFDRDYLTEYETIRNSVFSLLNLTDPPK